MTNGGKGRRISYVPRLSQMEAYDLLPLRLKRAHQEGPCERDTYQTLRHFRKLAKTRTENQAIAATCRWLEDGHNRECARGVVKDVPMLRTYTPVTYLPIAR